MNKFNDSALGRVFEGIVFSVVIVLVMGGTFAMFLEPSVLFA